MFIRVDDLHKAFGKNRVLRGVDLTVDKGDSLVILGGSGTGKSVFLQHVAGLMKGDQGTVHVDGVNITELDRKGLQTYRRRLGMSFQEGALFDSLTAYENVAFPLRRHQRNMSEKDVRKRVEACLEMVGMPSVGGHLPSELSGGMRRRVGFARAIALQPEILLFDEPTTGLDPILTSVLNNLIVELREQLQATTLTITHDIGSAKHIATHVAMLYQGSVIHHAPIAEFFDCENPIVQQFIEGRAEGPATEALYK